MLKTLLLSLTICVLVLAHVCVGDLSIRWAYNIQNARILERLDVSKDMSFVVSSVNFQNGASLYAFSANPGTISGAMLWNIQVHSEQTPTLNDGLLGRPSISPDGNYVAVGCQSCQSKNAFVFAINGNSPTLIWSALLTTITPDLTKLVIEGIPAWRPDSSFVYFQDVQLGNVIEFQISTGKVSGRAVVNKGASNPGAPSPVMSSDGKFLYACGAVSASTGVLNRYTLPFLTLSAAPTASLSLYNPCAATGHLSRYSNMLYIGDNNGTYAIDVSNGQLIQKWYYATGFNVYSAPAFVYYTSTSSPSKQVKQRNHESGIFRPWPLWLIFCCRLYQYSPTARTSAELLRSMQTQERYFGAKLRMVQYRVHPLPSLIPSSSGHCMAILFPMTSITRDRQALAGRPGSTPPRALTNS